MMRVLIADDDDTSRLLLRALVKQLGHECVVAEDGAQAWQLLSAVPVDVLLSDWMMPGLDGPALCRRVREELAERYTYIVLITGLGHKDRVLEGMRAGADDYLIKPVDPFDVQTRLIAAERVTALHRQVADYRGELERVNSELLTLSRTDPLTGIGNRRRMEEDLLRAQARADRVSKAFSVALFDIDYFKLYNDHYGHVMGDHALREVAHSLGRVVRHDESIYRYGGEEFLLLLPDCDVDGAMTAAERARAAVEDAAMPHEARPTPPPVVTISGAATAWLPHSKLTVPQLLARVDYALYQAKSAGRNRVHRGAVVGPDGQLVESSSVSEE